MASVAPLAAIAAQSGTAPDTRRGMRGAKRYRLNAFRYLIFCVFGLFFLVPLLAMARFSVEGTRPGQFSLSAWTQIPSYPGLLSAIEITLELALLTCAVILLLVVPTLIWIQLRVRWISRAVEFLCLLPLTIPAIVLVVGLAPIYNYIRHYNLSALQLFWVYGILALPYSSRALAAGLGAVDLKTLSEAARSLGASWLTVIWRIVVPNMWQALLNAMLLTTALVLGEFTVAVTLLYTNLQTALYYISRDTNNAGVLFSTSTGALVFAFMLLMILSYVGRRRRRRRG